MAEIKAASVYDKCNFKSIGLFIIKEGIYFFHQLKIIISCPFIRVRLTCWFVLKVLEMTWAFVSVLNYFPHNNI